MWSIDQAPFPGHINTPFNGKIHPSSRGVTDRLMKTNFLDFEQPIAELEAKIDELRHVGTDNEINISEEITRLEAKNKTLTESIFGSMAIVPSPTIPPSSVAWRVWTTNR